MDTTCWSTPTTLTWRQSERSCHEFSLFSGGAEAARLTRHGWGGYAGTIITPFGRWELSTEGFWKSTIRIQDGVTGTLVAECSRGWMSQSRSITWHDGHLYEWRQVGLWSDAVELVDPGGRRLISVQTGTERWSLRDLFTTHGRVAIEHPEPDRARLALLAVISWYLLLIHREEMASAVVIM